MENLAIFVFWTMVMKYINLAYPNCGDLDKFKANSINHETIFKGNIDFVK